MPWQNEKRTGRHVIHHELDFGTERSYRFLDKGTREFVAAAPMPECLDRKKSRDWGMEQGLRIENFESEQG